MWRISIRRLVCRHFVFYIDDLSTLIYRQAALAAMMMELSHSLTLNEEALQQIPAAKRPLFIFEWLRFLDKVLVAAQKVCTRDLMLMKWLKSSMK